MVTMTGTLDTFTDLFCLLLGLCALFYDPSINDLDPGYFYWHLVAGVLDTFTGLK